jgi:saccharopine dehydrogenase-like NADP-dependent oxidoreductase
MTNILVFGAGKSSSYLIRYLLEHASKYFWQVTVADANMNAALERIGDHSFGTACQVEIHEDELRKRLVSNADIVISLLPPALHFVVAHDCLELKKNLVTASYVSDQIKSLHTEARNAGLLFMNEMGLDPGIDHMSAMKIIDEIERLGGEIYSFKSYCGGLVAPISDTNPWHYKISWNPRNIVLAGKSGAHYQLNGFEKQLDYKHLFRETELIDVPGYGKLSAYANRDSMSYKGLYGLDKVKTMLRATFRHEHFSIGWDCIVNLGLTNEDDQHDTEDMTYLEWFMKASSKIGGRTPQEKIQATSLRAPLAEKLLDWLGILGWNKVEPIGMASSADILQRVLEDKWKMNPSDKDMIVMHHEFEYGRKKINARLMSTLIVEGEDKTYTAMAKTVGLPMAIFTKLLLTGKIKNLVGVQIPIMKEVYKPVLKELSTYGVEFSESYLD